MSWVLLTGSGAETEAGPTPGPSGSNIGLLHVEGLRMKFADGRDYDGIHVTAFREFELFLRWKLHYDQNYGDQLKRWMDWKVKVGFTGSRVFSYHKPPNVRPFDPREFGPDYYPALGQYLEFVRSYNQRLHFVLFLGAVPPDDPFLDYDSQYQHAEKCLQQIRPRADCCEVEVANEGEDNNMADTVNRFPAEMFAGVMSCRTRIIETNTSPAGQPYDQLNWQNYHPERKGGFDSTRKMRDLELIDRTDGYYRPTWADEPEKAGYDGARTVHPENGIYADQYAQNAAGARLFGQGLTVHGDWDTLQQCNVPTGEVAACCENAVKMWRAGVIPCEAQEWTYARDGDAPIRWTLRFATSEAEAVAHGYDPNNRWEGSGTWEDFTVDPTGSKHAYAMIGGNRAAIFNCEPGKDFILEAKPGWKIVRYDPTKVSAYLERT